MTNRYRTGSLRSNGSLKSKTSDDLTFRKPAAPAKPPRSARSSSTGSKDSAKKIVAHQNEPSEQEVFEAEGENHYTILENDCSDPIEPVIEEIPQIQLRDVVLDKTMKMDRSNDAIFNSTTSIIKELTQLKNSCDQNGA